jgi:hypothetical protein
MTHSLPCIAAIVAGVVLHAQAPSSASVPGLPVHVVDLTEVVPLIGMPPSSIMGLPHCSSGGDIYLDVYGVPDAAGEVRVFPDLYRISPQHEVKRIPRPTPSGYKQLTTGSFFAGERTLVSLIQAFQPAEKQENRTARHDNFFLAVTDRDGDHARLISLNLPFDPAKVAVFDSGLFVAIGIDRKARQPVVALLREDGTILRFLDLDSEPKAQPATASIEAQEQSLKEIRTLVKSLGNSEFVPWGTDIVLGQPESEKRSIEFGAAESFKRSSPEFRTDISWKDCWDPAEETRGFCEFDRPLTSEPHNKRTAFKTPMSISLK